MAMTGRLHLRLGFVIRHLTPNMLAIQPPLTWSKWNEDEICGLKFYLSYVEMQQDFFGNSSMCT